MSFTKAKKNFLYYKMGSSLSLGIHKIIFRFPSEIWLNWWSKVQALRSMYVIDTEIAQQQLNVLSNWTWNWDSFLFVFFCFLSYYLIFSSMTPLACCSSLVLISCWEPICWGTLQLHCNKHWNFMPLVLSKMNVHTLNFRKIKFFLFVFHSFYILFSLFTLTIWCFNCEACAGAK